MTMPRPSGKAQKIAEMVVPGLRRNKKSKPRKEGGSQDFMSKVESEQTKNIENRKGLVMKSTSKK